MAKPWSGEARVIDTLRLTGTWGGPEGFRKSTLVEWRPDESTRVTLIRESQSGG